MLILYIIYFAWFFIRKYNFVLILVLGTVLYIKLKSKSLLQLHLDWLRLRCIKEISQRVTNEECQ